MAALTDTLRRSISLTASALADMQASMTLPLLLHDAVALKRARGDTDVEAFKLVAREFGSGLNATVEGALWGMWRWVERGLYQPTPAIMNFLEDLRQIQAGTFAVPK